MTKEQAEFIAARVPGAKAVGPSPNSWVRVNCGPAGVSCDASGVVNLHGWPEGVRIRLADIDQVRETITYFNSALADARAAGILPQEGEAADHE